jgi:hypothetical protein
MATDLLSRDSDPHSGISQFCQPVIQNRTQRLIWNFLESATFEGEEFLLEALLRRGFLAYRDQDGLWLGTGSHKSDAEVLQLVPGLASVLVPSHRDRYCGISLVDTDPHAFSEIARSIISLGEHHVGAEWGGFSCFGLGYRPNYTYTWPNYCKIFWGAQVAVCPAKSLHQSPVQDALDIGIALLVKSLPLAGVVTALSCDGHGIKPAFISFCFDWDRCWCESVFSALSFNPLHSVWEWGKALKIHPKNGYGDESVTLMLEDIQQCARKFLESEIIHKTLIARRATLSAFPYKGTGPSVDEFREEANRQLKVQFGQTTGSVE